jgi:phage tail sheath protein FI
MPGPYPFPGVYIEEIPSSVRPITAVATSNTAFIDYFPRGPEDEPVKITSWGDFERVFGGLDRESEASYAVQQYYLNGGSVAFVVRITAGATPAKRVLAGGGFVASGASGTGVSGASGTGVSGASGTGGVTNVLEVRAASGGEWGNNLQVAVDRRTRNPADEFNLVVREVREVNNQIQVLRSETYRNLSLDTTSARFAPDVVNDASSLVRLTAVSTGTAPDPTGADVIGQPKAADFRWLGRDGFAVGTNGPRPSSSEWQSSLGAKAIQGSPEKKTGLFALETIQPEIFNILCIPAIANLAEASHRAVIGTAQEYCRDKRAFFIVDIPAEVDDRPDDTAKLDYASDWLAALESQGLRDKNAAAYFPRLRIADPLNENRLRPMPASGTVAGVYARTDATRGVWKAPAGTEASLRGAAVDVKLTDDQNGSLNPFGLNALRTFPVFGSVSWGARTLDGADIQASEWKYIPVRRTALFIEESLFSGLKWVVFEPNDEPLWSQIRLNVTTFMHNLFRQGAFAGRTPREAYLVKCDAETTTQADIDLGIVNIIVGFAPLKPAEFVILKIQQLTRQPE